MTKRHRLRVVREKAEELDVLRGELLCPKCKDRRALVQFSALVNGKWRHLGDKCPECSFEFWLRDAPC